MASAVSIPWCGAQDLNIGNGFHLTEYMFGGSPEFTLEYLVPNKDVTSKGASVASSPIRVTFQGLPFYNWDSPRIGYSNFDVRGPDGPGFTVRAIKFDCGGGISLSISFPKQTPLRRQVTSFSSPFSSDQAKIRACLQALQHSGRFTFTFTGDDDTALKLKGPIPLRGAIEAERRFRESEMLKAKQWRCQIPPPTPPIPVPPAPRPPPESR
jgi:hypothetical protein